MFKSYIVINIFRNFVWASSKMRTKNKNPHTAATNVHGIAEMNSHFPSWRWYIGYKEGKKIIMHEFWILAKTNNFQRNARQIE